MSEPALKEQKGSPDSPAKQQLALVQLLEQISRRDQKIAMAMEDTQRQKREIGMQTLRITELESALQDVTARHSEKEQKLAEITNSKAWKVVLILRGIRDRLLPAESRQGRAARSLLKGIKNAYHKL